MKHIKKILIIGSAAAAFALTPAVSAQISSVSDVKGKAVDTVKDEAVKKVKDVAKEKAYGSANKDGAVEKAKAYGSGSKDGAVDKVKAKATDKAYGSGNKDGAVEKVKSYGSGDKGTVKSAPATSTIACPSGTTAQPNGTCMITGNYKGS